MSAEAVKIAGYLSANQEQFLKTMAAEKLSLTEDAVAFGSSFLMAWFPVAMLVLVIVFVALVIRLAPKIVRGVKTRLGAPGDFPDVGGVDLRPAVPPVCPQGQGERVAPMVDSRGHLPVSPFASPPGYAATR